MFRFLLDANISHETADFLNSQGHDAKTVAQFGLEKTEDLEIVEKAIKEKRIIVTFDLDFGEIYYFSIKGDLWIIVLRLKDQTVESVNRTLDWLLKTKILEREESKNTLMLVREKGVRIRKKFEE